MRRHAKSGALRSTVRTPYSLVDDLEASVEFRVQVMIVEPFTCDRTPEVDVAHSRIAMDVVLI